jgi:short-subunit dehydrogenase
MAKKTVWIIGASNGIGEEVAKIFAENNFNIVISARSLEKLNLIASQITEKNSNIKVMVKDFDVVDFAAFDQAHLSIIESFGFVDIVIFASAIYQPASIYDFDLAQAKQTIEVNLTSVFNLFKITLPKMVERKSGHIAIIASVAGYRGLPKSLAYGASKAGLINLCESVYPELKKNYIDLSIINPGFVKTRLTDKNNFEMPFIITAETAAKKIFEGILRKDFEIHFPKKLTLILKFLRILPNKIFLKISQKIV